MSNRDIRWKVFPRDELPEALLSPAAVGHSARYSFDRYDLRDGKIAAGVLDASSVSSYAPLSLFVVDDESAAETFSWLKVYSPATFPLSQFGRVVSTHDWRRFESTGERSARDFRPDKWASVVVGEAMAQGEADMDLAQLPLSRASACFTMAVARAAAVHGSDEATRACADRLSVIEGDRRFVRRLVAVSDLLPIWSLVDASSFGRTSPEDAAELVLQAVESHLHDGPASGVSLRDSPEFRSDSIEERVLAFQRLVNELTAKSDRRTRSGGGAATLAAAAFMVGRGTSHAFLLHRTGKLFPSAPVWFGLMAALAGVEAWDADWTRATKSVERQIRSDFGWTDASGFDLCWVEFAWLAGTFEGMDVFFELPKLAPRAVTVEIIPGAICQFRLTPDSVSDADPRVYSPVSDRERQLHAALTQFIGLAAKARQLLDAQSEPMQTSLNFEGSAPPVRASKVRKGRGPTEK